MTKATNKKPKERWMPKESVHLGDFLHWLEVSGHWLRGVDQVWRIEKDGTQCMKCGKKPHYMQGWGWVQQTAMMSVCDRQIKREIPPKTADEWDRWGR